jgi:hypothetical protein
MKSQDEAFYINRRDVLVEYGLTEDQAWRLVAGSAYFYENGGVDPRTYWDDPKDFNARDEFYLIMNSYVAFAKIIYNFKEHELKDWLGELHVAYLYFFKLNAQSVKSIDVLLNSCCYADAFALCRLIQSRVNLLLLCAYHPEYFDEFLKKPLIFRESRVRKELASCGISVMDHVYRLSNEIIHGHLSGNADIGYFEKGLFVDLPLVRDRLYVILTYVFAASVYSITNATLIGASDGLNHQDVLNVNKMYDEAFKNILHPWRLEHLFAIMAEDRHCTKVDDENCCIGGVYDLWRIKEVLKEFYA